MRLPLLLLWSPPPERDVELPPAGALRWAGADEARGADDERAGLKFRGGDCGAARGAEKLLRGELKFAFGAGLLRGDEKFAFGGDAFACGAGLLNRGAGLLRGGDEKFALGGEGLAFGAGLLNRGPTSLLRDPGEAFTFGKGDGFLIRGGESKFTLDLLFGALFFGVLLTFGCGGLLS